MIPTKPLLTSIWNWGFISSIFNMNIFKAYGDVIIEHLTSKNKTTMSVSELIGAKASQLPPELQAEVLDFIQLLADKKAKEQDDGQEPYPRLPNKFGAGKGLITYISDDFDEPLDDLKDYMF